MAISEEQRTAARSNDVTRGDKSYGVVRTGKQYKLIQFHPSSEIYKELGMLRLAIIWLNVITMPIAFTSLYAMSSCDNPAGTGQIATVVFSLLFAIGGLFMTIYATIHDPRKRIYSGAFFLQVLAILMGILSMILF